jgi:hypothetical protein
MRARQPALRSGSTGQFDFEVAGGRSVGRQTSRIDKGPADYRLSGRHSAGHSGRIAVPILPIMLLDGEKR